MLAGDIVLADWRDALPKEANKLRPAIVVENSRLFDPEYGNVVLVPITEDAGSLIPSLALRIEPTSENGCGENGCGKPCYAASHLVTAASNRRLKATPSRITTQQLDLIRRQIAIAIGVG